MDKYEYFYVITIGLWILLRVFTSCRRSRRDAVVLEQHRAHAIAALFAEHSQREHTYDPVLRKEEISRCIIIKRYKADDENNKEENTNPTNNNDIEEGGGGSDNDDGGEKKNKTNDKLNTTLSTDDSNSVRNNDDDTNENASERAATPNNWQESLRNIAGTVSSGLFGIQGNDNTTNSITNSERDNNTDRTCPICLEEYKPGDEICSSPNEHCDHVFHASCMTDWLMNHDNCPLCRADYLNTTNATNSDGDDNAV
jgi:hypothetical protein